MPKEGFSAEQIVTLFRQIEVSMAQGKSGLSKSSVLRGRRMGPLATAERVGIFAIT